MVVAVAVVVVDVVIKVDVVGTLLGTVPPTLWETVGSFIVVYVFTWNVLSLYCTNKGYMRYIVIVIIQCDNLPGVTKISIGRFIVPCY